MNRSGEAPERPTGFVHDSRFRDHVLSQGHPEAPVRLEAIEEAIRREVLWESLVHLDAAPDTATVERAVKAVHSAEHIESIEACPVTGEVAFLAVSRVLGAVDSVCRGDLRNAFCAVRPPGHHAHNNGANYDGPCQGQGFCFLNNVAIAARYARDVYRLRNVLIVDWDYHHGNGTEWRFYDDPSVFYYSTHVLWTYPGTGSPDRTGAGEGSGYTLNVPLEPGSGDAEIIGAFENTLSVRLRDTALEPDLILISAGFDSREEDWLGNLRVTDDGYARLTRLCMDLADRYCEGKIVSVLEGGYNPRGLADSVVAHLRTLSTSSI